MNYIPSPDEVLQRAKELLEEYPNGEVEIDIEVFDEDTVYHNPNQVTVDQVKIVRFTDIVSFGPDVTTSYSRDSEDDDEMIVGGAQDEWFEDYM